MLLDDVGLHFLRNSILWEFFNSLEFDEREDGNKIEVTCTLNMDVGNYPKEYEGCAKTVSLRQNASEASKRNAIDVAKEKAKKKAEAEFFEYIFDEDEPTAFTVDQFGRPVEEN